MSQAPPDPDMHSSGGTSHWRATADVVVLPPATGSIDVDVAVVGGGIVGLTTAVLAAEAGLSTVVLEAREIGAGTTGGTTGKLTAQNGTRLSQLRRQLGVEGAVTYTRANRRGMELFDDLVERHAIDCGREVAPAHLVALTARQDAAVREEIDASLDAGLEVVTGASLPEIDFPVSRTLTLLDQRQMHAIRYLQGLADALTALGGTVHQHSRVVDLDHTRRGDRRWLLTTEEAVIEADDVVLATRLPTHRDTPILFGRTKPVSAVGIAARTPDAAPRGMYLFKGERSWSIRGSRTGDGEHLIAVGMSEDTGDAAALRIRSEALTRWVSERFETGPVEHAWMAQDQQPSDGRPYVGPLWRDGLWTATGFGKWGLAAGTAAAELLVTRILDAPDPYGGFFSTGRLEAPRGWPTILRANLRVGALFLGDRARSLPRSLGDLAPGEGRVVRRGRTPIAVSRDDSGTLHAVSAVCTHLGCLVRWNGQERSWDCPCHGSRFAPDGAVLEAPASAPLAPVEPSED